MKIFEKIETQMYNLIKIYRWRVVSKLLDVDCKTLLDIGCRDQFFYNRLKDRYRVTLADHVPKEDLIKKENVQNLTFGDKSFDIVLCQQTLEHVLDPVKAISELKRVTGKQLIISVPHEPFFTLFRLLCWQKGHLWAITPKILKFYLDAPTYEKKIFFKRYYIAMWRFD